MATATAGLSGFAVASGTTAVARVAIGLDGPLEPRFTIWASSWEGHEDDTARELREFPGCTKQRGEYAEIVFTERALRRGHVVSCPYGDSAAYDFVVGGAGRRLKRVQVKSAWGTLAGRFVVAAGSSARPRYTAEDIDVLAVYVVPEDAWYLIPVEAFAPRVSLTLNPRDPEKDEWARYREAWWRLGRVRREFVRGKRRKN